MKRIEWQDVAHVLDDVIVDNPVFEEVIARRDNPQADSADVTGTI